MSALFRGIELAAAYVQGKGYGAGTVDREVRACLKLVKDPPRLFVDIGANKGDYTASLLALAGSVEAHLFEPSSENVRLLSDRFRGDARVHLLPYALGASSQKGTLTADFAGSGIASLTRRRVDHFGIQLAHTESVSIEPFAPYWRQTLSSRTIDLVKIDVEGHELDVLQGMGDAVDAVRAFQFEFGGCNIDTRTYFQDFWYFFAERSFELYRIAPFWLERVRSYREVEESFRTTNYIALRRT